MNEVSLIDSLLRPAEVARLLSVSRTQAYRLMRDGQLRCVRFGVTVRVRRSDLMDFIEHHLYSQVGVNSGGPEESVDPT